MNITGNLINAYFICKRKMWLYAHQVSPDIEYSNLSLGRLIAEETYKREKKEIEFENIKLDLVKSSDGDIVVGEVKKSSRGLDAARKQLLYYLYRLKEKEIIASGELLVPKEKKKEAVILDEEAESEIEVVLCDIQRIVAYPNPPALLKCKYCAKCAYNDFCWDEVE
jgi:CRISPR-associated exonuclease Cas4